MKINTLFNKLTLNNWSGSERSIKTHPLIWTHRFGAPHGSSRTARALHGGATWWDGEGRKQTQQQPPTKKHVPKHRATAAK